MFALHAIQAKFGDCLLLEYGTTAQPHFILIDGGPPTIFSDHLQQVLQQKVAPPGSRLERVIISHVDNDHIIGLLDLFAELESEQVNAQTPLVTVAGLWHNSFRRTIDPNGAIQPRLQILLAVAGMQTTMDRTAVSLNGIAEGNRLRQKAQLLHIPINPDHSDPITVDSTPSPLALDNLQLTVVGPTQANLDALREEWEEWLDRHEDAIGTGEMNVMANADRSVPNLSSICVVGEADGRRLLLTGDARSDHVQDGLRAKGFLDSSDAAHFDVLKLPHHGSDRNMTKKFFRQVTADQYVISANGKYGNPDLATLIWLVEAGREQNRHPQIIATNKTPSTDKLLEEYPASDYGYTLSFLAENDSSIEVFRV
jgi:beta-lactamase superfamily II metal-dependent hydrolase